MLGPPKNGHRPLDGRNKTDTSAVFEEVSREIQASTIMLENRRQYRVLGTYFTFVLSVCLTTSQQQGAFTLSLCNGRYLIFDIPVSVGLVFAHHPSMLRPSGDNTVPYAEGHWIPTSNDNLATVTEFHKAANYHCGRLVIETHKEHFLCGYLSQDDLGGAIRQSSWQWEPEQCSLPGRIGSEFNTLSRQFFTKAREKAVFFIGDSLYYQQFLSSRCLLGEYIISEENDTQYTLQNEIEVWFISSPLLVSQETLQVTVTCLPSKTIHRRRALM